MKYRKVSPKTLACDQGRQLLSISRVLTLASYVGRGIGKTSGATVRIVRPVLLGGLFILQSEIACSQEDPGVTPELLIPDMPATEQEPNGETPKMLRSSGVPLRATPDANISTGTSPEVTEETNATDASAPAVVEPVASVPAFRTSPVPGDTALMRVTDDAVNAIARPVYTPAFRSGLVNPRPLLRRGGIQVGPLLVNASLSLGLFLEKDTAVRNGEDAGWQTAFRVSPSVSGILGYPEYERFLTFDYAASLQVGGREQQNGALDQAFSVDGHYGFAKLKLQAGADYSLSTGVDRDVGAATDRTLFGYFLDASYPLSAKSVVQAAFAASHSNYAEGLSSRQFQGSLFLDRQMTFKTRLGLGATLGTLTAESSEDQVFEQIHLRATYLPTPKFSLSATGGVELRQIGGETSATPIFSGAVDYQVRPSTSLQLAASRTVSSSAIQRDSNFTSTTVTFSISQQIGMRVRASVALGYQHASYDDSLDAGENSTDREDHYIFLRPTVTWQVAENLNLSLFYSFGDNRSSVRPFQTQQLGLNGTFLF